MPVSCVFVALSLVALGHANTKGVVFSSSQRREIKIAVPQRLYLDLPALRQIEIAVHKPLCLHVAA